MPLALKKGFTLVELIIVIVILAILATIAFLSFNSQSAAARDSARLSDIANILKGLGVFNSTAGNYPMPDQSVENSSSGVIVSYQGSVGPNIIKMIKMSSDGGKDPLDGNFYTYSVSKDRRMIQLLGFLEDRNSSSISFIPFDLNQIKAEQDYSKRYVYTKGDQVGIVLSSGTLSPIQLSGTGINDTSTGTYILQLDNKSSVTGAGYVVKYISDPDMLAGYWKFDEGSGSIAKDSSGKGNNGIFSGGVAFTGGKSGYGVYSATDTGHILIDFDPTIIMGDFTISVWVLFKSFDNDYGQIINTINGNGIAFIGKGPAYNINSRKISFYLQQSGAGNRSNSMTGSSTASVTSTGSWHNIIINRNGQNSKMLLDGFVDQTSSAYSGIAYTGTIISLLNSYSPSLGYKLDGIIDELRIYRRSLSDTEMKTLYDSLK